MLKLKAEKRNTFGRGLTLSRKDGKLPVVAYGSGENAESLFVSQIDFLKLWKEAGETTMITLEAPDFKKDVLIQDVTYDPVKDTPIHVDFLIVRQDRTIAVNVPISFVGEAPAVKSGGTLVKVLYEVEVEALPKDLPHELEVDVSTLDNFEAKITVKDIKLSTGVKINADPEEIVALVSEIKVEEEVVAAPIDLTSIEVEKKGKKEEEEVVPEEK